MLLNGGQLNGKRLLGVRTVELMRTVFAPDTLPGRPRGEGFGLSVRVVADPIERGVMLSAGSFGWSGAFGTHFLGGPEGKDSGGPDDTNTESGSAPDFETAVMQAIVE